MTISVVPLTLAAPHCCSLEADFAPAQFSSVAASVETICSATKGLKQNKTKQTQNGGGSLGPWDHWCRSGSGDRRALADHSSFQSEGAMEVLGPEAQILKNSLSLWAALNLLALNEPPGRPETLFQLRRQELTASSKRTLRPPQPTAHWMYNELKSNYKCSLPQTNSTLASKMQMCGIFCSDESLRARPEPASHVSVAASTLFPPSQSC